MENRGGAAMDLTVGAKQVHAMKAGVSESFLRTVTGAPLHFTQAPCTIVLDGEGVPRYA